MIQHVLQSRHRPESVYRVDNLTQLLQVASKSANALTLVLLAIALVTLIVSGVGIMNIMLANVRTRIREIGIRKAIGATSREIRLQFLTEAVLISLAGGIVGTVLGLALPYLRALPDRLPHPDLRTFGHYRDCGCHDGGRDLRHRAGNPRRTVGSGGSAALRISSSPQSRSEAREPYCQKQREIHELKNYAWKKNSWLVLIRVHSRELGLADLRRHISL